jgi:hypothetical protein
MVPLIVDGTAPFCFTTAFDVAIGGWCVGEVHQGSVVENAAGCGLMALVRYGMLLLACEVALPFDVCS